MHPVSRAAAAAFSFVLFAMAGAAAQEAVLQPMDAFELEFAADPQISPDGSQIVYVRNYSDVMTDTRYTNLWIVNADGSGHRPLTTGKNNDTTPRWSPDGTRIAYIGSTDDGPQIFVRWMDTGTARAISHLTSAPAGITWSPDGTSIAFTMHTPEPAPQIADMPTPPEGAEWKDPPRVIDRLIYRFNGAGYLKPGYHQIYVIPAEGGTARQISDGPYDHAGPGSRAGPLSWTADGSAVVISVNRNDDVMGQRVDTNIYRFDVDDGRMTQLTDRDGPDDGAQVSPDGRWIAYDGFDDRLQGFQRATLYVMPAGGGAARELSAGLDHSVSNLHWAPDSKSVYFSYSERGLNMVGRATLDGDVTEVLENAGGQITAYGSNAAFSLSNTGRIAALYSSAYTPSDVGVARVGRPLTRLTDLNSDVLGHLTLGQVEEVTYQSSIDNRPIQGWIVKPPGFDADKKYPLFLEIHGGPFANYGPRFDFEMQLMAAKGYVVLYVNPRGSTSYGEEFANLIHHAYPGDDFYDLNSGVDAVVSQGYIDTDRLYVGGGSGGGVLTAWTIGHTDRFRAASIYYPVIDWTSFVLTADIPRVAFNWFPGVPWEHVDEYWKRSLLSVVANVTTPSIIITGEADYRTPISQSEEYYTALKLRGVEAVAVRIPDEPHGTRVHPSHWLTRLLNTLGWFERHK